MPNPFLAEASMLDLDRYRQDGYLVLPGFADPATLDGIAGDIAALFARQVERLGLAVPAADGQAGLTALLETLFRHDRKAYLAAARLGQYLLSVHRLGVSDGMMAMLAGLGLTLPYQSTRPVIHFMADSLKFEGGYHKTPPHQDWRSVQTSLDGVTTWLPLYDVGPEDYPLEVIPGSHRLGLLESSEDAFGHRVAEAAVPDRPFETLTLGRGDLVVFSGFLVHRTGAAGGPRARIALSYRFGNASEASYVARTYPYPYSYKGDMTLMQPDFPLPSDLEPLFGSTG